ncbi:MAG: LysR family transcriptional regulator [Fimbriimonadaceae bacterium]|nr:LysR family transcriptional regulator [Alphaproteobacteria bacterium]
MDLNTLKLVLSVAQHGSIAASARQLDLDPSTVSRNVAAVEHELGIRLYQRTTRKLTLTEEGQAYLDRVEPLIDELDAAREHALQLRNTPSGTLRMTCSVAFALQCMVPRLARFHELYTDIKIELLPTDDNVDLLTENIDLAVRLAPAPKGDLISAKLMSTKYHVVASPQFIAEAGPFITPSQLARTQCLRFALPGFRSVWRFRDKHQNVEDVEIGGRTIIANAAALREATKCGMGAALLADWLIAEDLKSGALVDLFPNHEASASDFDTAAWLLYPSRIYLPQKVRVMIDFLKQEFTRGDKGTAFGREPAN